MKTTIQSKKPRLSGTFPIVLFIIGMIIALIIIKYLVDYLGI